MKVIEKPLIVGGFQMGTFLAYTDIEPELIATEKGIRVLPAPFFYEKGLYFTLSKRYEPGENKFFPNGGYVVRSEYGQARSYDLDQVIIHPAVIKHQKTLDKMMRKIEKMAKKKERAEKREAKARKPKYGKRGRPALSPEEKARREAEKANKKARSGGKRGRPASDKPKMEKVKSPSTGKRGRRPLTDEEKAKREQVKAATKARSGGKRGRPASANPKPKKEPTGRPRGRPSLKK